MTNSPLVFLTHTWYIKYFALLELLSYVAIAFNPTTVLGSKLSSYSIPNDVANLFNICFTVTCETFGSGSDGI